MKGKEIGLFLASVALVASGCGSASATPKDSGIPATPGVSASAGASGSTCRVQQEGPYNPVLLGDKHLAQQIHVDAVGIEASVHVWEPADSTVGATPTNPATEYAIDITDQRVEVIGAGIVYRHFNCSPAEIAADDASYKSTKENDRVTKVVPTTIDAFNAAHPGAISILPVGPLPSGQR